jgi:hypothetical protein
MDLFTRGSQNPVDRYALPAAGKVADLSGRSFKDAAKALAHEDAMKWKRDGEGYTKNIGAFECMCFPAMHGGAWVSRVRHKKDDKIIEWRDTARTVVEAQRQVERWVSQQANAFNKALR